MRMILDNKEVGLKEVTPFQLDQELEFIYFQALDGRLSMNGFKQAILSLVVVEE